MNDVIHQFWQAYLYTSAGAPSGLAVTVWLLVVSVGLGFVIALFLSVGRVSSNRFISAPIWVFGYVFRGTPRSEEHTSELQSLMRISYAVFCLKKKIQALSLSDQTLILQSDTEQHVRKKSATVYLTTYNIHM